MDPTPDPTLTMGIGEEALDVLKRAGVAAEEMTAAVMKTGKEAAQALGTIILKIRDLLAGGGRK